MALKVIVPNKGYNAFEYGVEFLHGEAVFENEEAGKAIAKEFGYAVEEIVKEAPKKSAKKAGV